MKKQNQENNHKQKNAQRYRSEFGLDTNAFGLNGQDFGLTQLKKQAQQQEEHRRSLNSTTALEQGPGTPRTPRQSSSEQLVATKKTLESFADDVATLWCGFGGIPVLDEPPSSLTFLRDYVSRSRPCIIRNALLVRDARKNSETGHHGTKASHLSLSITPLHPHHQQEQQHARYLPDTQIRPLHLSLDDIVDMDPDLEVTVDATPDGHGDCVRTVMDHKTGKLQRLFVTPEQRKMTLREFRKQLREGRRKMRVQGTPMDEKYSKNNHHDSHSEHDYTSRNDDDGHENDDTGSNSDQDEVELFDELDGKRIYGLKGSKKKPKPSPINFENLMEGCTPTNVGRNAGAAGFFMASCNPLDEMQDMISSMPFFNDLIDGSGSKEQDGYEVTENTSLVRAPPPPLPPPPSVLYYSRQNDCFRNELPTIYEATRHVIPDSIQFAEEAFGNGKPEAINLWMGDERAVSSMHKDPYENLFYVASGEKIFTLCPPADAPYLYEKDFLSGSFDSQPPKSSKQTQNNMIFSGTPTRRQKRTWTVKTDFHDNDQSENNNEHGSDDDDDDDNDIRLNHNVHSPQLINHNTSGIDIEPIRPEAAAVEDLAKKITDARPAYVRWIEADMAALADPRCDREQMRKFPMLKYAHPIRHVRVQAGELLYLPALWFHRVTQSRETIGLNWWYNMNFCSPQWCYFQLLTQLQVRLTFPEQPGFSSPAQSPRVENGHGTYDDEEDDRVGRQKEDEDNIRYTSNFPKLPTTAQATKAFDSATQAAEATIRGVLDSYINNWDA
jgi:Cupin-like domain